MDKCCTSKFWTNICCPFLRGIFRVLNIVLCRIMQSTLVGLQKPTIKERASIGGQHLPVVQISIQLNVFGEN